MKKIFGILGIGLLLTNNVLPLYNTSFAYCEPNAEVCFNNGAEELGCFGGYEDTQEIGCYVFKHYYRYSNLNGQCLPSYKESELVNYKCDTNGGELDLRNVPLESGQHLVAIGENAFSGTNVSKLLLPSTIEYIGYGAFCNAIEEGNSICGNEISEGENCVSYPMDESDFVEVNFPEGMNNKFDFKALKDACAKMHEYKVRFETEDGKFLGEAETQYQYINPGIIPEMPAKESYIGGWYLGDILFDRNEPVTENITLVYKYLKGGIEYNDENGWIRVFLGDQQFIVKDKNQGAIEPPERYDNYENYVQELNNRYINGEIEIEDIEDLFLKWINENVGEFDTIDDFLEYLNEFENILYFDLAGYYYFWGNNVGVNLKDTLDQSGNIDVSKFPEGFNHGYIGLDGGNNWTNGSNDTPCDSSKGEYLPSMDDWKNLMKLWGIIKGYNVYFDESRYYFNVGDGAISVGAGSEIGQNPIEFINTGGDMTNPVDYISNLNSTNIMKKFFQDFLITGGNTIFVNGSKVFIGDEGGYHSSLKNNVIGFLGLDGLYIFDVLKDFDDVINNEAMPVRCFVKASIEDNNSNSSEDNDSNSSGNKYSGGGGSVKKENNTTDNIHNVADEKEDLKLEKMVESDQGENLNNIQNDIDKLNNGISPNIQDYISNENSSEIDRAYNFARSYGITEKQSVQDAKMYVPLTRIQMAKMLSQYAINVLGKEPDISRGTIKFDDVTNKMDKDYDNGVTLAYQLGIMGQNMANKFRPNDEVTRAEFATAFSRMLYGTSDGQYKSTPKYYINHMNKLKQEGIITKDNPKMKELRGYVMIMLMRSAK